MATKTPAPYRKADIREEENEKTGAIEFHVKITEGKRFIAASLFDTLPEAQKWAKEKQEPPKQVTYNG